MLKLNQKKAQAVTELAVFGAILIYLMGTIVRTAVGNSYTQNQNFKAMRMAMLSSWKGSLNGNIARNSASVLIVEDRLSPDISKYGDIDRNLYVANGSGSFTYELLYPLSPGGEDMQSQMTVMDAYINGQYFPFSLAQYVTKTILSPNNPLFTPCSPGGPYESYPLTPAQCLQNQCLRNQREWVGGIIWENMFENVIPALTVTDPSCNPTTPTTPQERTCQAGIYASDIFLALSGGNQNMNPTVIKVNTFNGLQSWGTVIGSVLASTTWTSAFSSWFTAQGFPTTSDCNTQCQIKNIESILNANSSVKYKLFYAMVANPGVPGTIQATPDFSSTPPVCATHPCMNQELSSDLTLGGVTNGPTANNPNGGDLMYDLLRNGDSNDAIESPQRFPPLPQGMDCSSAGANAYMRCNISWQWSATAGTTEGLIGLSADNNQFPSYDVDGRLKEQTIYGINYNAATGEPTVTFADAQLGDIDPTWDANTCSPKPGLQNQAEIYTFTQAGTYLQIKEGQLLNPETGQVVRSINKRDTIDLIQRTVQLSNNTGRFCPIIGTPNPTPPPTVSAGGATSNNPVEACVDGTGCPGGPYCSCFSTENNIKSTCFDERSYMLYVRSRLQDLRGHFWMTNTSGQLKVQK